MAYSIFDSGTTEQNEFFYMIKISETRYQRFCSKDELTLDYMTAVIDKMINAEEEQETQEKADKEGIEANVS
tara:strand:+ start:17611 stop:17826 length:216 start_codon:yes stop_codon:yes gene_type:complete